MRSFAQTATLLALWLSAATAHADADKCIEDHEAAGIARRKGALLESRTRFVGCARDECPGVIREECAARAAEVLDATPSVILAASDGAGGDLVSVAVRIDGVLVRQRLDGKPHLLDPGEHSFTFEAPGRSAVTRSVLLRQGEKARRIEVTLPTSGARPSAAPRPDIAADSGTPIAAWVLGGVGIAALGVFTGFAIAGRSKESELSDCSPACAPSEVDVMQQRYLVADIALAAGVLALGASVFLFVTAEPSGPGGARSAALGLTGDF